MNTGIRGQIDNVPSRDGARRSTKSRVVLRGVVALAICSVLVLLAATVLAQSGLFTLPGDPAGADDLVFVDIDAGANVSCGVTAADNIRCWGDLESAPAIAEGFVDVAVGTDHACGIKTDGTVQCWSSNNTGELINVPVNDDGSAITFSSITSDFDHACGIRADDDGAVCWGWDFFGQVSGVANDVYPNVVEYDYSGDSFAQIETGYTHTCGINKGGAEDGQIVCWGDNIDGDIHISEPPDEHADTVFKSIALGASYTCGVIGSGAETGKVVCWGLDQFSVPEETPINDTFEKISSGENHVCGVKTDGTIDCWGAVHDPDRGGDEVDLGQVEVPAEYANATFSDVTAGQFHSCGILDGQNGQTEGEIVCWGAEFPYDPLTPTNVDGGRTTPPDYSYPPTSKLAEVDSGWTFNCGLDDTGDMRCWGGSIYVQSFAQGPFETLAVGSEHACAISANDGRIKCWGNDRDKRASGWTPGADEADNTRTQHRENLTTAYSFKYVAASDHNTCGILDGEEGGADGTVVCWGANFTGESAPPLGNTFDSISLSYFYGCGLLDEQNGQAAGQAACWGEVPPIPIFDFDQDVVPAELVDVTFTSISSARYHTCAVRSDTGSIECWGSPELAGMPDEFADLEFSYVDVSTNFSCGVTTDNRVKCWGPSFDSRGPIAGADYNFNQYQMPDEFADLEFASVSTSLYHVCATEKAEGKVLCWGADADPTTPELDIYSGAQFVFTRQSWVPASYRAGEFPEMEEEEQGPRLLPTSDARILRIEPTISAVAVSSGDEVRFAVDVYGAQDILDNSLGDGVAFDWSDGDAGGDLDGDGREVTYTAPERPGTFTITIAAPSESCRAPLTDEVRCAATFDITVRRSSAAVEPTPVPVNPAGTIPSILTDSDGNQYEVFTPEGGGTFTGDASSLKAGPGVVPNGEIVGLRISEGGSASNEGMTYQRYSLGGSWYEISAVDSSNTSVSSYGLSDAVEVCIPLPDALRSNISSLALVVINADDSLTILSSIVRISSSGTNVCGSLSSVPAKLAVGTAGSPAALPTAVPDTADMSDLPDTGGAAPSSPMVVFWILIVGLASIVVGGAMRRARRNSIK